MSSSRTMVGNVTILDRGDGPAQEVLDRNARAIAQRVADETREELNKVMGRVKNSLELFETSSKLDIGDPSQGSVEYLNDLAELEELLNDQMKRKKYQQQLTVFIVGYQNKSNQRLRLLQQISEFFTDTVNRWEADEATPKSPDFDLEETDRNIHESLQTATELTGRLGELNREMMDYMYSYATSKAGNKNRKKLEKSLVQAKEDIALMSEKVALMQKDIEEKDEKIQQLFKQVEMKTMETQRLKAAAEVSRKSVQDTSAMNSSLDSKDTTIRDLQKKIESLELDLRQKEASREQTQKELLMSGRESMVKVKELEEKLQTAQLERMQEKRALQEFGERQLTTLANVHRQEMTEVKAKYESEIGKLKLVEKQDADVKALQYQIGEHKRQVEVLKQQLDLSEASKQKAVEDALRSAKEQSDAALAAAVLAAKAALPPSEAADGRDSSSNKDETEGGQGGKSKAPSGGQTKNNMARKTAKSDAKGSKTQQRQKDGGDVTDEVEKTGDEAADDEAALKAAKPLPNAPSEPPAIDYESSFFDEGLWSTIFAEHMPEVFPKYRNKAVEKLRRLEGELEDAAAKAAKKVDTLKAQFHEHKERWQRERDGFVEQIEVAQKMRREAELEADAALNKLEDFISEQESLEKDEEKNALARQQTMAHLEAAAAAAAAAPAAASAQPAAEEESAAQSGNDGVEAGPEDLLSMTDDAKVASQSRMSNKSRLSEVATSESAHAGAQEGETLQLPFAAGQAGKAAGPAMADVATSPAAAVLAKVTEHMLDDLRQLIMEERLDDVQQTALSEFRSAIEFSKQSSAAQSPRMAAIEEDKRLRTLTVFGLASKLSAESYYLGYDSDSLLQAFISLYANGGKLLYSWKSGMSAISIAGGDGTSLSATKTSVSRNSEKNEVAVDEPTFQLDSVSVIAADNGDTDSVTAVFMSKDSVSQSRSDMAESLRSESIAAQQPISGRSSPESRASVHSKYRSMLEDARASLEDRRRSRSAATSRMSVPSKASFHDAELDEDGDMPFPDDTNDAVQHSGSKSQSSAAAEGSNGTQARLSGGHVSVRNQSTEISRRSYYDRTTSFSLRATSVTSYSPVASVASKEDAATSPHFVDKGIDEDELDINTWKSPRLSSHPVVVEFLKVYEMVYNFKEAIAKALQDRDMMSASQILSDIEPLVLDEAIPVTHQIEDMTKNVGKVLDETSAVVDSALTSLAGKDYRVSSLLSVDRRSGTAGSLYSTRQNSADFFPSPMRMHVAVPKTPAPVALANTPIDAAALKELQQRFEDLQKEHLAHKQKHELEIQHNTVMLMEMQDHVADLQRRLSASSHRAGSAPTATAKDRTDTGQNSPVMFTRLDAERNTKNLKRAAMNNRVDPSTLLNALAKMEAYISIPEQRLNEMVKKYVHMMNMRRIAKTIRDSQILTGAEFALLSRMEALQSHREKHWQQRMDELGHERLRQAAELTRYLEALEVESGIFLIKPIFSYQGSQIEDPYVHEKVTARIPRNFLGGSTVGVYARELQMEPINTPVSPALGNQAGEWTSTANDRQKPAVWQPASAWDTPANGVSGMTAPLASSSLPALGYSWSVNSSLVKDRPVKAAAPLVNTPRILEMDVNRMMYGQSQVSAKIPTGSAAGDRASTYLRSYVTVSRPVKPPSMGMSNDRPSSGESARLSPESKLLQADNVTASWPSKGKSSPLPPIVKAQGLGGSTLDREYSEDAITPNRLMKLLETARSDVSTPDEADEYDDDKIEGN